MVKAKTVLLTVILGTAGTVILWRYVPAFKSLVCNRIGKNWNMCKGIPESQSQLPKGNGRISKNLPKIYNIGLTPEEIEKLPYPWNETYAERMPKPRQNYTLGSGPCAWRIPQPGEPMHVPNECYEV